MAYKDPVTGLTAKQEAFAQARASGMTQRQAYKAAYTDKGGMDKTADENGCRVDGLSKIRARVRELQKQTRQGAIYERDSIQALLAKMIDDPDTSPGNRLKALDMLNRMQGSYIDRKEVTASVQGLTRDDRKKAMQDTLDALKSRISAVDSPSDTE